MRRNAATLLLLTAAAACACAQTEKTCPINLYAQRQSPLVLWSASEAARPSPSRPSPAQGLHVTLNSIDTPPIESIDATLHGLSTSPRVLPTAPSPTADITKDFHLQRKAGEKGLTSFNLWMSHVGVLRWVDVTSITYADGTSWHSPQPSLCRAIPSPFLLVDALATTFRAK